MKRLPAAAACLLVALISGCTSWQQPPPQRAGQSTAPVNQDMTRSKRGNMPVYEVFGKRYRVMNSSTGYKERGIASWYGPKFHGRLTSSGERYDMYRMTAAHKTLPLPTNVRVTNLENGKSVIVRVNDRGPFVDGRIIDLSKVAAEAIDMTRAGTVMVEVEALQTSYTGAVTSVAATQPAAGTATAAPPAEQLMYVQVGAFGEAANARQLAEQLTLQGVTRVEVREPGAGEPILYRVRIGPFSDVNEYDTIVAQMATLQITTTKLVVEEDSATRAL